MEEEEETMITKMETWELRRRRLIHIADRIWQTLGDRGRETVEYGGRRWMEDEEGRQTQGEGMNIRSQKKAD